jgi:hypothetical protein
MSHKIKVKSMTSVIAEQLNEWLISAKKGQRKKILATINKCWEAERIANSNIQAHTFIVDIYEELVSIKEEFRKANIKIGIVLVESLISNLKLESFADIFYAKKNNKDLHSYPHKAHKLEIVSGKAYDFGQFIVEAEEEDNNG